MNKPSVATKASKRASRPTAKSKPRKKADWVAVVRKHKPAMNALTDTEREELMTKALDLIYGADRTKAHVRRG